MDDKTLKSFDTLSDESDNFEELFSKQSDEKTLREIVGWLKRCTWHGKFIAPTSPDRRALRSIIERWKSNLQLEGYDISEIGSLDEFDPQAGIVLDKDCPYPGLKPYNQEMSSSFFGRDSLISYSLDYFTQDSNCILLLIGASGSGKSSLALAGILPLLKKSLHDSWHFCPPITPGVNPISSLALSIAQGTGQSERRDEIEHSLSSEPDKSFSFLARVSSNKPLLLLIDQFEELFTLCNDEEQKSIFGEILKTLSEPNTGDSSFSCNILLTLRTDQQSRFESNNSLASFHKQLFQNANTNIRYLTTLDFSDIQQAIRKPANSVGLRFIPATLINQLASQTAGLASGLPLLQFTLQRLWKERPTNDSGQPLDLITEETFTKVGQVEHALGKVAKTTYEGFTDDQKKICERLLLELIVLDDRFDEPFRRRRNESEIIEVLTSLSGTSDDVDKVIGDFIHEGLLCYFGKKPERQIEVAHEALLRHWDYFYRLLMSEEIKERILLIKQIGKQAVEWQYNNKSKDYLNLKGAPLQQAHTYRDDKWLTEPETLEYVEACSILEKEALKADKEALWSRRLMFGSFGLLTIILIAVYLYTNKVKLDTETLKAQTAGEAANLLSKGNYYYQLKNYTEAKKLLARANDLAGGENESALLILGWIDQHNGAYIQAFTKFDNLIKLAEQNPSPAPELHSYYYHKGVSLLSQNQHDKARAELEKAVDLLESLDPGHDEITNYYYKLGLSNSLLPNMSEKAIENFEKALEAARKSDGEGLAQIYFASAEIYRKSPNTYEKAEDYYKKGIIASYHNTEAKNLAGLGTLYFQNEQGSNQEAISLIKEAIERSDKGDFDYLDYQVKLAQVYMAEEDYPNAEYTCNKLIREINTRLGQDTSQDVNSLKILESTETTANFLLGNIFSKYAENDKIYYDKAIDAYMVVYNSNPQDALVRIYLADVHWKKGDKVEAERFKNEAANLIKSMSESKSLQLAEKINKMQELMKKIGLQNNL